MTDNILVIEREPRDADLVRQALAGQPFSPSFVREGEETLRALDTTSPRIIVLPSDDLVGLVRGRAAHRRTPVVVVRQPFSPVEFLGDIKRTLDARATGQLTSNDIFGDILADDKSQAPGAKKAMSQSDDLDKLLADTLSDVMPKPKPKTQAGVTPLDKKLQDTLSGIEKSARGTTSGTVRTPVVPPVSTPAAEKTHIAQPILAPVPPPMPEEEPTDGTRFGQYVLLEKIASGGMAEVWKARMRGVEGFQKIVAIKRILPHLSDNQEFIEMFIDEAKLAAQLNHANIIHIYDLGKIQSSYYIAMEYVAGSDLKTILKHSEERDQPINPEVALFIASKVAAALDYAHRKDGLVHRDVSPQNVLISEEGDIKLCDFGIAKAASKASHTQAGALKGKLQYMSPEQAWGKAVDRRSDIFALAAVLFELLTRKKLFTGDNEMSILEQVREASVTAPSQFNDEVTPEIDAIVLKALQKDPANRYQTAGEMAKDIDALLYNYRPTPTAADLAIYMHRLNNAQPVVHEMPLMEPEPAPAPTPVLTVAPVHEAAESSSPNVAMPSWNAPRRTLEERMPLSQPEKKSSAAVPIGIAAVLAIAAIGGFLYMRSTKSTPPAAVAASRQAAPVTGSVAPAPIETTQTIVPVTDSTTSTAAAAAATSTQPVLDPAKVNEEVQRRLAAERTRLEDAARAQQAAAAPRPAPVVAQPAPRVVQPQPQPVPQTPAPQPAVAETRPAPVQPAPQPVAPTAAPAPAPAAAVPVKEGDMVTDLEGLTPARMIRRASVPYPPLARMQRVEGTVLIGALVSETGAVMETRIIKPINKPVGLNEAAEQIVRRSQFSPPLKDGVRVKAWTTVPIDFKL
jgi:TonB family protein